MNNYICEYGFVHDKPCIDQKSSSNNGWIYTAYLNQFKAIENKSELYKVWQESRPNVEENYQWLIKRRPDLLEPPISRDEIIGMVSLGAINIASYQAVLNANWSWINYPEVFKDQEYPGLWTQIKAVFSLKDQHRNYVWRQEIYNAYPIVFKLAPHDVYYLQRSIGLETSVFGFFMFSVYAIQTILAKDNNSARNILWLQLKDLKSKILVKFVNHKKSFGEYFPKDHPVNKIIRGVKNETSL